MRLGLITAVVASVAAAALASDPASAPDQPVPYSHRQHVALGLKCAECHTMPDPGELMTFPLVSKCMACHRSIKPESPSIQKLSAFASGNRKVPWVRVYQIPSYVFFSHKSHLAAGAGCKKCHGSVTDRDKLWKETDISMGGCMECHRKERASLDCNYCHDPRQ